MTTVDASPTKQFFVKMLTRDIELTDAILDLLDNSLDGAVRTLSSEKSGEKRYEGYWVKISMSPDEFMISDNCGGIPLETAQKYAFRMGRGPDTRDASAETIGMYGIGMKRAMFKMGEESYVTSRHRDDHFNVHIPPDWLSENDKWTFELTEEEIPTDQPFDTGTEVLVTRLHEGIASTFSDPGYAENLASRISSHYALVLDRGLRVSVNDITVTSSTSALLYDTDIKPSFFRYAEDGVEVFFAVGLNAAAEEDPENTVLNSGASSGPMKKMRSFGDGGWTVYCNERAVLVRDKTVTTGWGDTIPGYHAQFAVISGFVQFRSTDANKLPVTTTKRGLDTSNALWMRVRSEMIKAIAPFITYTNKWRNTPREEQDKYFNAPQELGLQELKVRAQELESSSTTRNRGLKGAKVYTPPKLPTPPSSRPTTRRVIFTRPIEEIKELGTALFDDADTKPGQVGDECFSLQLEYTRSMP